MPHSIKLNTILLISAAACSFHLQGQPIEDEGLHVRRIIEFWKDKESQLVKSQIRQFLNQYPQSDYRDTLLVILGDIFWNEGQYSEALKVYESIKTAALAQKVFNNRIDCLYQMGRYVDLEALIHPRLQKISHAEKSPEEQLWAFYYAQALIQKAKNEKDPFIVQKTYQDARRYLESLQNSVQSPIAQQALAEVYAGQGEPQKAVQIYLELSQSHPENEESLLLRAAKLQTALDPVEALLTYSKIQQMKGKNAGEATISKALLLFETRQYLQLIREKDELSQTIPSAHRPTFDFIIGRSYFALGNYQEAFKTLEPLMNRSAAGQAGKSLSDKAVLMTLIASAYHLSDVPKVEAFSKQFEIRFPFDDSLANVWYIKAMAYKDCGRLKEAQQLLEDIMQRYPNWEKNDSACFERSLLLFKQKRWEESRAGFLEFVGEYIGQALSSLPPCNTFRMPPCKCSGMIPASKIFVNSFQMI